MSKKFKYIPKDKRKKILLICDDIRVHSGVATVAKEIVVHTSNHFNWSQIAGAIKHPEKGKVLDLSSETDKIVGIKDSHVKLFPVDGYGNEQILRDIIRVEKPDAIMLFTDPRYFDFVFRMEAEIRKTCPIIYLNIWDDLPAPMYNSAFYEACDLLLGISKQTVNINKLVLKDKEKNRIFKYLPHGKNEKQYYPLTQEEKSTKEFKDFKKSLFKNKTPKFVSFFNSRNIRRKQIPDTLLAFREFLYSLPKEEAKDCYLVLHTEAVTDHGTDLYKVKEYLFGEDFEDQVIFSHQKYDDKVLNWLYNIADVQILITSNEGWGLTLTEAILAGTPIIANTTGGMQDQMRFVDNDGKWFTPDANVPSNHRGTYKEHGEWAFPVYPTSNSIQGSPPTPYIFDDRCTWEDVTERLKEVYSIDKDELKARGLKGREWAIGNEAGFTSTQQAERFVSAVNELFDTWEPREKYEIVNANEYKGKFLNHKINY